MNKLSFPDISAATKYLFFDTESANCFNGISKICEISFIVTDKDFNVLHEQEITINPKAPFHLLRKGDECHIRYEADNYKRYRQSPPFHQIAPTIQAYFNARAIIPIGFSSADDIGILDDSYRWARMISPGFACVDIQPIAKEALRLPNRPGLLKAAKGICEEKDLEGLHEHWSLHDAMMTMLLAKALSKRYGGLEAALLERKELVIVDSASIAKKREEARKNGTHPHGARGHTRARTAFKAFEATLDTEYRERLKNPEFVGKRFSLSAAAQDMPDSVELAKGLMEKGYFASPATYLCDAIICVDREDAEQMKTKIPRELAFVERSEIETYFK